MAYSAQKRQGFSWPWMFFSIALFIGIELFLGGFVPGIVTGRYISHIMWYKIELILMLGSYYLGGVVVGFFSPSIRIFEPALGAFLAVIGTWAYGFFVPVTRYFGFASERALIGGAIVFVLALLGADGGERLAARLGNRASQDYVEH